MMQVDYVQPRDCQCANATACSDSLPFPCYPQLTANPQRVYDYTGPLAVCPLMWYRSVGGTCVDCPSGTFTSSLDAASCSTCPYGKYSIIGQVTVGCIPCPATSLDARIVVLCSVQTTNVTAMNTAVKTTARPPRVSNASLVPTTTAVTIICGDGIVDFLPSEIPPGYAPEQCDPGPSSRFANLSSLISIYDFSFKQYLPVYSTGFRVCSSSCALEINYCGDKVKMPQPSPIYQLSTCLNNQQTGNEDVCTIDFATYNGTIFYWEECDDGNVLNGDGCSSHCKIERLFICVLIDNTYDSCTFVCGNGRLDTVAGEQCDDGNLYNGDGCSSECTVECGFQCRNFDISSPSQCNPICGDGLVASLETCDVALVPVDPDNPAGLGCSKTCQIEVGWECTVPRKCYETTNWTQVMHCHPACGDSIVIPPEECDDGDWNLADKACLSSCKLNHGSVCYGPRCLMPVPSAKTSSNLPLMYTIRNADGVSEGVILIYGPAAFTESSETVVKALALFSNRSVNTPTIFPTVYVGGSTFKDAVNVSLGLTCPICAQLPQTPWKATSGTINEQWNFLSNNVSCIYSLQPELTLGILNFTILQLVIDAEELCFDCMYLEITTSIYNSPQKLVKRLNRTVTGPVQMYLYPPVDVAMFSIERPGYASQIGKFVFQLTITFETISQLTPNQLTCLSACTWNKACAEQCFDLERTVSRRLVLKEGVDHEESRRLQGANLQLRAQDNHILNRLLNSDATANLGQILAINFQSIVDPSPEISYPCQFSQYPSTGGSLLLPLAIQQVFATDPWFEGSWFGSCSVSASTGSSLACDIVVYINGDTIIKHSLSCPLAGYAIGRILSMGANDVVSVDEQFLPVYYKNAVVEWTSSSISVDNVDRTYQSLFSFGYSPAPSPQSEKHFQILFEGATQTNLQNPIFLSGGILTEDDNCRLLNLRHSENLTILENPSSPQSRGNDEEKFITCNQSMSSVVLHLQNDPDCLVLIRAFWFRDFWSPLNLDSFVLNASYDFQPLQQYACSSECLKRFQTELTSAINNCKSSWNTAWFDWNTSTRLFKLLISASSALYWTNILCLSNQDGISCASAFIPPGKFFQGLGCGTLLPQSLYGPHFFQNEGSCQSACKNEMEAYVSDLGCCSALIQQEGSRWLAGLTNSLIGWLSIDFGDRTNPFNISFPNSTIDPVIVYFESGIGTGIVSGRSTLVQSSEQTKSVSVYDMLVSVCQQSCFWPQEICCNSLTCTNGNKPYIGACSCSCPQGFDGVQCNLQGYFVQLVLIFPGYSSFSYCEQSNLISFISGIAGLDTTMLGFTQLSVSTSRRLLAAQSTDIVLRLRQSSCDDANRLTQKMSSFFSTDTVKSFESINLTNPSLSTIVAYCSGIRTVCGWSGTGKIDLSSVITACNSVLGNSTITAPVVANTKTVQGISWIAPVAATIGVVLVLFIGGVLAIFRSRIFGWFGVCIPSKAIVSHKKRHIVSAIYPQNSKTSDIVFAKFSEKSNPKNILISNVLDANEVSIEYQNDYKCEAKTFDTFSPEISGSQSILEYPAVNSESDSGGRPADKEILSSPLYISSAAPANETAVLFKTTNRTKRRDAPVWSAF